MQQKGFRTIQKSNVISLLSDFNPVLAGTLPLDLFIEGSDLDIICFAHDLSSFEEFCEREFRHYSNFNIRRNIINEIPGVIVNFTFENFPFELFAQGIPTEKQNSFLHLKMEYEILQQKGSLFREKILDLKKKGIKTEPAFAQLLRLQGDPYTALLSYRI
ncbi:MAG: DUF4269 domain-containing protein [Cyclobacteriaceae bacterium]|nr:DUF4269 domain-containing protein [Cyclobacteriaceae bacterium]